MALRLEVMVHILLNELKPRISDTRIQNIGGIFVSALFTTELFLNLKFLKTGLKNLMTWLFTKLRNLVLMLLKLYQAERNIHLAKSCVQS